MVTAPKISAAMMNRPTTCNGGYCVINDHSFSIEHSPLKKPMIQIRTSCSVGVGSEVGNVAVGVTAGVGTGVAADGVGGSGVWAVTVCNATSAITAAPVIRSKAMVRFSIGVSLGRQVGEFFTVYYTDVRGFW